MQLTMHRIAPLSVLAALLSAVPLVAPASAGDGYRYGKRAYFYAVPASPWDAWRAYYTTQAEISFARRAATANYYAATGRAPPARYFGPPTNYYAERYALDPYSYFNCPQARRGEGICPNLPPLSAVP
ncbi:MAG TPA: hypothetical protein VG758_00605 [Hyphomicrobiaceae bacterium]|jgi:hypothetical protein|nr:hypothetical protein [Hyphomicrobiaceae bacterium]